LFICFINDLDGVFIRNQRSEIGRCQVGDRKVTVHEPVDTQELEWVDESNIHS